MVTFYVGRSMEKIKADVQEKGDLGLVAEVGYFSFGQCHLNNGTASKLIIGTWGLTDKHGQLVAGAMFLMLDCLNAVF